MSVRVCALTPHLNYSVIFVHSAPDVSSVFVRARVCVYIEIKRVLYDTHDGFKKRNPAVVNVCDMGGSSLRPGALTGDWSTSPLQQLMSF